MNINSYESFVLAALESAKEKCRQTINNAVGANITIGVGVGSVIGAISGCSSGTMANPMYSQIEGEFSEMLDKDYQKVLNNQGFKKRYIAHKNDKQYLITLVEEAALSLYEHVRKIPLNTSVNSPEN